VVLGDTDTHRSLIIEYLRQIPREQFDSIVSPMMNKCKKNSYEMITVFSTVTEEGTIVLQ
jgi:hypothetical protein